jgi:NADPH2:quinone reductase
MKALVLNNYGLPPELQEVPKPTPAAGEVLIKVKASGLNPLDLKIMAGQAAHAQTKLPAIPGIDASGIVEAVGEGVSEFSPGDEVYGMVGGVGGHPGSLAEYVVTDARGLARKPARLPFHDAAAIPLIFITAWEAIVDRANVQAGQKLLIHGGAGGVGHIAAQIARARGAEVYATVRGHHFGQIKGYGAIPIDFTTTPVDDYVNEWTGGEGFDVILDNVGGKTLDDSFRAVRRYTGHVVSILGWGTHSLAPLSFRGATYSGIFTLYPLLSGVGRAHHGEALRSATTLIDAGKLIPMVSPSLYNLETAMDGYREIEAGAPKGKVVVDLTAE